MSSSRIERATAILNKIIHKDNLDDDYNPKRVKLINDFINKINAMMDEDCPSVSGPFQIVQIEMKELDEVGEDGEKEVGAREFTIRICTTDDEASSFIKHCESKLDDKDKMVGGFGTFFSARRMRSPKVQTSVGLMPLW